MKAGNHANFNSLRSFGCISPSAHFFFLGQLKLYAFHLQYSRNILVCIRHPAIDSNQQNDIHFFFRVCYITVTNIPIFIYHNICVRLYAIISINNDGLTLPAIEIFTATMINPRRRLCSVY